jgi:hypothetical protein
LVQGQALFVIYFLPNIGRLAVEMAVYQDKTLGKQLASLFTVLADAFNPLGGSSLALQIAAPTVLDPFVALAQNKDWTGRPIYIENVNAWTRSPGSNARRIRRHPGRRVLRGRSTPLPAVPSTRLADGHRRPIRSTT